MSNPGIILQARLTSKRFPNKVLCPFMGKPVIEWVIEAVVKSKLPWILAVPKTLTNLGINSWAKEFSDRTGIRIRMSFGSEDDLIWRYREANNVTNFDPIIRICCDSPFVAPEDIELALKIYEERKYFTQLNHVQVFSAEELDYAGDNHVFDRQHAGTAGMAHTIDYPEDIKRITREWNEGSPTMDGRKRLWNINK